MFLYHENNVIYVCLFVDIVVKCNFIIAVSKLEQPSCLIVGVNLGKKLYLDEFPVHGK